MKTENFADETNTRLYDLKSVHDLLDTIGQNYIDIFCFPWSVGREGESVLGNFYVREQKDVYIEHCIKLDDVMLVFGLDDSLSKAAL